ncbi:MAG: hypothetical protein HYX87_09245 [Chloroflexi bacterium]|nr:hypothetical protein [Chloroflexota bacterium]
MRRQCAFPSPTGKPCRMAPLTDSQFCWAHSPERAKEAQEARRLGGLRRRRERTLSNAYQFDSLTSADGLARLLHIAVMDTLALDNGVARNRILVAIVLAGLRVNEAGDMEQRISALEQLVKPGSTRLGAGAKG